MGNIENSKAIQYAASKGWDFRTTDTQINVEECPICHCDGYKFYMSYEPDKNGAWTCFKCSAKGNLYDLRTYLGDRMDNVTSMQDVANSQRKASPLPNVEAAHRALMDEAGTDTDNPALEYLLGRGYTMGIIEKYKLGLVNEYGKRWLLIPYFHKDNLVFAKFRTLPPDKKEFRGLSGREAPLFNQDVLTPHMDELLLCEGEGDTLACLSAGVENVVGIPGANMKKAAWIKLLDDLEPKKIYILYDNDKVGQKAAREMAARIGIDNVRNICLPEFRWMDGDIEKDGKDINEWFRAGHTLEQFEELKAASKPFEVEGIHSAAEIVEEIRDIIQERGTLEPRWRASEWESLNRRIRGYEPGDLIGVLAEAKRGKMQPLSAKVLTVKGWTTMGQLSLGDRLASVDGRDSVVTDIITHGVKDTYRVTFSDGRSTLCGLEHLWTVGDEGNFSRDGWKTVDTQWLLERVPHNKKMFVPMFKGDYCESSNLPLDPWLLGVLLGDGGLTNECPIVTKKDATLIEALRTHVAKYNCHLVPIDGVSWRIVGDEAGVNPITNILRSLNLMGHRAETKFVPWQYLNSDRSNRLLLIAGLLDTDGSLESDYKMPCFNTSSPQLAKDFLYLARSIGATGGIESRSPHYSYKGEKLEGLTAYRIRLKIGEHLFLHSEKAHKEGTRRREARLTIVSVEKEGREEQQCIAVSHPSQLYVTDDFIVTHNTTVVMNILDFLNREYEEPVLMFCQEMQPPRLVRKWMAMVTDTDDKDISLETVDQALVVAANRKADYLFGYTTSLKRQEVFDTIRQAVRRYGVKFVCFDNLQLLCRSIDHFAQETSATTKEFKQLAMELGIVIFLIMQPSAVREGEIVNSRKVYGSSAPKNDVDAMLCLHRNMEGNIKESDFAEMKFMELDENFGPELMIRVDLSRYSAGGVTTLLFDGAKSKVTEMTADQIDLKKNSLSPVDPMNNIQPRQGSMPVYEAA